MARKKEKDQTMTENSSEVAKVQTLTIQGIVFEAPAPYAEGHVVTANEASVLNQTLGENLRNNFAAHIKTFREGKAKELEIESYDLTQEDIEGLKAKFAEYAAGYEFNGKRAARQPIDPVDREARKLAKEVVKAALNSKNIDLKSVAAEKMDELIDAVLAKRPDIREEAERRINAAKAAAGDVLDGLI